jgi:hypothetical protein
MPRPKYTTKEAYLLVLRELQLRAKALRLEHQDRFKRSDCRLAQHHTGYTGSPQPRVRHHPRRHPDRQPLMPSASSKRPSR